MSHSQTLSPIYMARQLAHAIDKFAKFYAPAVVEVDTLWGLDDHELDFCEVTLFSTLKEHGLSCYITAHEIDPDTNEVLCACVRASTHYLDANDFHSAQPKNGLIIVPLLSLVKKLSDPRAKDHFRNFPSKYLSTKNHQKKLFEVPNE